MKIKQGDTVEVLSGNDKGSRGTVRTVLVNENRLVVSGVRLIKKHQKRTGDVRTEFGIIEREAPIQASNVAIVCPHCDKPARIGRDVAPDGSKSRVCRKCNEVID